MSREDFLNELSYLLQDMPEDEKNEALQYYEDYFEDAGAGNEAAVIAELGSPEKVAAMIRFGDSGEQSEYTERGYENPNYRGPIYEVGNRTEPPRERQSEDYDAYDERPRRSGCLKLVFWGVILLCLSPFILGAGGAVLGILGGILGILFAIAVSLAVVTAVLLISGIVLVPLGFIKLVTVPVLGVFIIASGCILIGLGLLFLIASVWVYGKLLPGFIRGCMRMAGSLFHRNRRGGETV